MSVLAADLEVKVGANIEEAIKKLSSIERYAQMTTNALNKQSKLNLDTKDAEKKLTSFSQKLKDSFKASLSGLNEAGRGLLAGDSVGFFSGLVDTLTGLTSQIPLVGTAATLAGNGVKSLIMPMEKLFSVGMQWQGMWEKNRKLLISAGDSAEGAEKQLNGLYQMAIKRGFQMDDLALIYQRLRSIGFSADDAKEKLKGFTNAAVAIGGGAEAVQTMAQAFEQMKDSEVTASRVIKQFERMGLPIMQTLSSATGYSTKQIREMMKKDQIDSEGLMNILTKEFQSGRFENLAENMAKGLGGQQNAFSQITAKLAGEATSSIRKVMGARLRDVNEIIGSDSAEGLILGFKQALDIPVNTADWAVSGFLGALKSYLGIHSPSALMRDEIGVPMGLGVISGVELALAQQGDKIHQAITKIVTREGDTLRKIAERYNVPLEQLTQRYPTVGVDDPLDPQQLGIPNSIDPKRARSRRAGTSGVQGNYQNLLKREPQFEARLNQLAQYLGVDPSDLLNVMAVETAGTFNPAIENGQGYTGLIQFGKDARKTVGVTNDQLKRMSATQQLDYVQKYFEAFGAVGKMSGLSDVYNIVSGGENLRGGFPLNPNSTVYSGGSPGYKGNRAWDYNRDGKIQNWELGRVAQGRGGFSSLGAAGGGGGNWLSPAEEKELFDAQRSVQLLQYMIDSYAKFTAGKTTHPLQVNPENGYITSAKGSILVDVPEWNNVGERGNNIDMALAHRRDLQDIEQLKARIQQLEARQQSFAASLTAAKPVSAEEPTYDFSKLGDFQSEYPETAGITGGIGSLISIAKEYLPDVLKLAGELRTRDLPGLKEGWDAANHAATSSLSRTTAELKKNRDEFKKSGQTLGEVKNIFQSTFASAFSSTEGGFKGMLGRFVTSFAQALLQMASQAASTRLADWIFGEPTSKGGGNWFSKILQWGISAIGGSISGGHAGAGRLGSLGSIAAGGAVAGIGGPHAQGGPVKGGWLYPVNEKGVEYFQPSSDGAIFNQQQMAAMRGGNQRSGNTYHIHVHVPPSRTGYMQPRDRRALAQDIVGGLQMAGAGA